MIDTTILVPVYDPISSEKFRLQRLIDSIVSQKSTPQKVIFSANHKLDYFKNITEKLSEVTEIDFRMNSSTSAASNLNQLMIGVTTSFTKFMFQDDFFTDPHSLSEMMETLEKSKRTWVASGCSHYYEEDPSRVRNIRPKFSRGLIKGKNTIGAPSVIAVKTENLLPFNEEMVYMFDCEWYLRMKHKFGFPVLVKKPLVRIGIHSNQATHWARESLRVELSLCRKLHKVSFVSGRCSLCEIDLAIHD
jgi:hypothetical protein